MNREPLRDAVRDLQDGVLSLLDTLSVLSAVWALPVENQSDAALAGTALDIVLGHPDVESASIHLLRDGRLERMATRDLADLLPTPDAPHRPRPTGEERPVADDERAIGRAAATGTLQRGDEAREPVGPGGPPASLIAAPIPGGGDTVLGVFTIAHSDPTQFTHLHERLATVLAGTLGHLLRSNRLSRGLEAEVHERTQALSEALTESQRLRERFEELALVDELTGLRNRRFFFSEGEVLVQRALRYRHPVSLIMLDLDHFKEINDTWGHGTGDNVLREISRLLESAMRRSDLLARFGGEEFVLLLAHTDCDGAKRFGERLCRRVARHPLRHQKSERHTTLTVGVSCHRHGHPEEPGALLDQLIREADDALYYGKAHGRNCVYAYLDLLSPEKHRPQTPD